VARFSRTVEEKGWRMGAWERNRVRIHLPEDTAAKEIFLAARAAGVQIRGLVSSRETLEDLFMKSIEE